ncbi:MAG TPA: hypothetical protein VGB37_15425 [Candidatus Lokiarchaeia archaeon]
MVYNKFKKIKWIEYYILGVENKNWRETLRNPFRGLSQAMGVENNNPHSVIDLRIGYLPYWKAIENVFNDQNILLRSHSKNVCTKKTTGNPFIKLTVNDLVLMEFRKSHPVDACYINSFFTFSFNLVNKYFPWIAFNFRPCKNYYFNFGIGWKGVKEKERKIAPFAIKCRVANYHNEKEYNPDTVAYGWFEGHI